MKRTEMGTHFFAGLDLGQSSDYSALAVLERTTAVESGDGKPKRTVNYAGRHLQRWPLGTPYGKIIEDLAGMTDKPPLRGCKLVVDGTGVGVAVVEMIRAKRLPCEMVPVLITAGHKATRERGSWHVPKKELASVLQVLLQNRRLQIAKNLPEAKKLAKELKAFKVKITTAGNEQFEAWRQRDHDDLVLAIALAAWLGERETPTSRPMVIGPTPYFGNPMAGAGGGHW